MHRGSLAVGLSLALVLALAAGCSIRRLAANKLGDALASGGSTYESDDDVELVGDALPFSLKLIESLLAETPRHVGLLRAACEGFTTYAYVYVQPGIDDAAETDLRQADAIRARTRRLYRRAHGYCLRGLEVRHPGAGAGLDLDPQGAVAALEAEDLPLLYWSAASLGLAISVAKGDAAMLARIPAVEALLARGTALDEAWNRGKLHEFEITLAGARPTRSDDAALERHYRRAVELSEGRRASVHVAFAEAVAVRRQDRAAFDRLLDSALAIDADLYPETRLENLVAQRRARWLIDHADDLFLDPGGSR